MAILIGQWNFEETSGIGVEGGDENPVRDSSGNGYHAAVFDERGAKANNSKQANISTVASIGGGWDGNNCFDFPAGGKRVALTDSGGFYQWSGSGFPSRADDTTSATISAMIKPNSSITSMDVSDTIFGISDYNTQQNEFSVQYISGGAREGQVYIVFKSGNTIRFSAYTTRNDFIKKDRWNHVCFVKESGAGHTLYINGHKQKMDYSTGSATSSYWLNNFTTAATTAMWGGNCTTQFPGHMEFTGKMDDCRFYDGALTRNEVVRLAIYYRVYHNMMHKRTTIVA